jgi:hypothetical protein
MTCGAASRGEAPAKRSSTPVVTVRDVLGVVVESGTGRRER